MDGLHAFGRGFSDAEAVVATGGEGVIIRITTKKNPELWVHLVITPAALDELQRRIAPPQLDGYPEVDLPPVPVPEVPDLPSPT